MELQYKEINSCTSKEIDQLRTYFRKEYGSPQWLSVPSIPKEILFLYDNNELLGFAAYEIINNLEELEELGYSKAVNTVTLPVLTLHHIVIYNEYQRKGYGSKIVQELAEKHDRIVCKGWMDEDGKTQFFETNNFTKIEELTNPWIDVDMKCNGCGKEANYECSGVLYYLS